MTSRIREHWATKLGLVLALTGNAVGLGNFLRFPVQAAENGGGSFLVPYFISLLLIGLPLMWIELAIGRRGGRFGYGTTDGMYHHIWDNPVAKYVGVLGIFLPLMIVVYYTYIVSWCLGFSFYSLLNDFAGLDTREEMGTFLGTYNGTAESAMNGGLKASFFFLVITLLINIYVLSKGIVGGIEALAKLAMPLLLFLALLLAARVLFIGTPDPVNHPDWSVINGLGFLWNPDFSELGHSGVWLAAAGQVFFTTSVGMGCICTYASYMREKDDIALTGLTAVTSNTAVEVILGASIAIPIAVAFFGIDGASEIAKSGAFDLGFLTLPVIFQNIAFGNYIGFLWFMLLFFAGITSMVALSQPIMAFIGEEYNLTRQKAALYVGLFLFLALLPVIAFLDHGFLDEIDYWVGTFGLVVCAFTEVIIFIFIFKPENAWREITTGASIPIPKIFYSILRFVTPLFLGIILITWFWQNALDVLTMKNAKPEDVPYLIGARCYLVALFVLLLGMVHFAWKRKKGEKE